MTVEPLINILQVLTPAQRAAAEALARDYITTILSTQPVDELAVEQALADAYREARREPPKQVRWFDSPLGFQLARNLSRPPFVGASIWASLGSRWRGRMGATVWASVRASVATSLRDHVGASERIRDWPRGWRSYVDRSWARVWASVENSMGGDIRDSVRVPYRHSVRPDNWSSEKDPIGGRIFTSVSDSVWTSVGVIVRASVWDYLGWQSNSESVFPLEYAGSYALQEYFLHFLAPNTVLALLQVNRATHGYFFGAREAWLVRRAVRLERDAQGRLHSEDGMAIRYADGWGIYAWHGVRLTGTQGEKIILDPEGLTRADWAREQDAEVRRVIQERLGSERFMELMGAESIHRDDCGELVRVNLGDHDPERVVLYVHVKDASTDREYYLRVPPTMQRARQAVAWTFDIPEAEYCPLVEA